MNVANGEQKVEDPLTPPSPPASVNLTQMDEEVVGGGGGTFSTDQSLHPAAAAAAGAADPQNSPNDDKKLGEAGGDSVKIENDPESRDPSKLIKKSCPSSSSSRPKSTCCCRKAPEVHEYGVDSNENEFVPPTSMWDVSKMEDVEDADLLALAGETERENDGDMEPQVGPKMMRERRTFIPDRPNVPLHIWKILKNAIGKDLSRIPIPVNFSEPLSMLQRFTEQFEYTQLLDEAAQSGNAGQELCLLAAFTVSLRSTMGDRTAKPFNPLLGETYECDRKDDKGWRCISEQVGHHPPRVAQHCQGRGWVMWQDFLMQSKFKGNSLAIYPLGVSHFMVKNSGNHYSFCSSVDRRVTTFVHNLILGKLWVDQGGEMDILNHTNGDKCTLKYWPTSTFGKKERKVTGLITNKRGIICWKLEGFWDKFFEATEIKEPKFMENDNRKPLPNLNSIKTSAQPKRLWTRRLQSANAEKYYNLTQFACQLNEMEDGVAPTDSRRRPDQRLMEEGRWDEASVEKIRLEDKQRSVRQKNLAQNHPNNRSHHHHHEGETHHEEYEGYESRWFKKERDPTSGLSIHVFRGEYWNHKKNGDWTKCPDIF